MSIVRCDMGHFFDDSKFASCPHCTVGMSSSDDEKTVAGPVSSGSGMTSGKTPVEKKVIDFGAPAPGEEKTIGIYTKKHGWDPVTGWLICIAGPERGRDYRLHTGRNFLGRATNMSVSVPGDPEITRDNHCSVIFEPKNQTFLLAPGSANTYCNGESVTEAVALAESDVIKAGTSEFIFIPYCKGERNWEK